MSNTIRTPKQGTTKRSHRIAQAVDNAEWQYFRAGLKGVNTSEKLARLRNYYEACSHAHYPDTSVDDNCDVCIRIDNYIKALCRGGQLKSDESLATALSARFNLEVIK